MAAQILSHFSTPLIFEQTGAQTPGGELNPLSIRALSGNMARYHNQKKPNA
jgi:hypothetical protein